MRVCQQRTVLLNTEISQGSAATDSRPGGVVDLIPFFSAVRRLSAIVKAILKSVSIRKLRINLSQTSCAARWLPQYAPVPP